MVRTNGWTAGAVAIAMALGGCGEDVGLTADAGQDPIDAGQDGSHEGIDDDAGEAEADAGTPRVDAGPTTGTVRWITEVEPREVDRDIALEYGFQYELTVEGDPFALTLTIERCIQIAGMEAFCDTGELSNLPGTSFVRFGVDPSMYAIGENHYTFHLTLARGAETLDEATLDVQLDVTACESCVGSGTTP